MNIDEEVEVIKNYLNEIQEELAFPFQERKKEMGVLENVEDELHSLLEEINNKEDQLKQVLELTNIVVNKKEQLEVIREEENQSYESDLFKIETELEVNKQTANQYQRLYQEQMEKNMEIQNALQQVEEQVASKDSQHAQLKAELYQLRQKANLQTSNEDQKQFIIKLQNELKNMEQQNNTLHTEIKDLRIQQKDLIHNSKVNFESFEKLQYENKNLKQNLKNMEQKLKEQLQEMVQYKEFNQFQREEIEDLQKQQKALQDTLHVSQLRLKDTEINNPSTFGTISQMRGGAASTRFSAFEEPEFVEKDDDEFFQQNHGTLEQKTEQKFVDADQQKIIKKKSKQTDAPKKTENKLLEQQTQQQEKITTTVKKESSQNLKKLKSKEQFAQVKKLISSNKTGKINNKGGISSKTTKKYKVPTPIKRDPYEEFFELIVQAIKINSPHMDDVLGINTKNWYKIVQGELIPFHKWYGWVNDKLHGIRNELIKSREKSLLYSKRVIVF